MKCIEIEELISGYLDAELTQQESQKVRLHLETCEHCEQIHCEMLALKKQMSALSYPPSDLDRLEDLETDLTASLSAATGWILLGTGALIVIAFAIYQFLVAPDTPLLVKIFNSVFVLGGVCLFISVLRQRLMTLKHDKYRKVKL